MKKNKSKQQYKSSWEDVHGIFLLNKPKGITSNAALQKVRKIFNAKKAGHTGSLDPMATGLLPCCFGDATKVAGLMLNADKTYIATCQIGTQTDTGDATGTVIDTSSKIQLSNEEIKSSIEQLTGSIKQIPPMYSALHHNGKRLYELARKGIEVDRPARQITIHEFKVLNVDNTQQHQLIQFETNVSKGTYIRTLLEDFAKLAGTFAHMTALHRVQLGILNGREMQNLQDLEDLSNPSVYLKTMDVALVEYQSLTLGDAEIQKLIHGLRITCDKAEGVYRLYNTKSVFLGLGTALANGQLKVKNLFIKSYSCQNS